MGNVDGREIHLLFYSNAVAGREFVTTLARAMTYLTHQRHARVAGGRGALDVNFQRAAEQRSELSPGRGFAMAFI